MSGSGFLSPKRKRNRLPSPKISPHLGRGGGARPRNDLWSPSILSHGVEVGTGAVVVGAGAVVVGTGVVVFGAPGFSSVRSRSDLSIIWSTMESSSVVSPCPSESSSDELNISQRRLD